MSRQRHVPLRASSPATSRPAGSVPASGPPWKSTTCPRAVRVPRGAPGRRLLRGCPEPTSPWPCRKQGGIVTCESTAHMLLALSPNVSAVCIVTASVPHEVGEEAFPFFSSSLTALGRSKRAGGSGARPCRRPAHLPGDPSLGSDVTSMVTDAAVDRGLGQTPSGQGFPRPCVPSVLSAPSSESSAPEPSPPARRHRTGRAAPAQPARAWPRPHTSVRGRTGAAGPGGQ